jgi:hypothetical protein
MTYAARFLRSELNREMAWEYSFLKDKAQDRKIHPERSLEFKKREREQRIVSIRLALQALKQAKKGYVRPEYYWLKPNT